ncbi:hypothetical protein [Sphingomonas pseudosanguinis]|uniref:Uncharacterized protein n=1 Tax=Sphingomonas pseudosanguinis TaxID=413712 RepID=A0A7W6F424_9SPHN|nr:hypothetical protein [Sphingomonas pseudosanguinis]MBB3880437.1 hypothetical protein [Sphingomonas pseudosanguinis]MBN3535604.1 hypothetical protein [Sphingomonas pseudosanguinis]
MSTEARAANAIKVPGIKRKFAENVNYPISPMGTAKRSFRRYAGVRFGVHF